MNKPKAEEAKQRSTEAGCRNLMAWKASQPGSHAEPNRKHGARSQTIRKRYSDLRTGEGQRLKAVIDAITADLGGPEGINAGQQVLLGGLQSKLIVIFQISDYLDKQSRIVDAEGKLLPCLGQNFLSYTESIRRDLEAIYGFTRSRKTKVPSLEELIARRDGEQ
jgi:hypothetical protein